MPLPHPIKKSPEPFLSGLGVPGHWWEWKTPGGAVIFVCCPKCHGLIDISHKHVIAKDGMVKPAITCRTNYCRWEDTIKLEDWVPHTEIGTEQ